jgi:hypothetical protein
LKRLFRPAFLGPYGGLASGFSGTPTGIRAEVVFVVGAAVGVGVEAEVGAQVGAEVVARVGAVVGAMVVSAVRAGVGADEL